MQFLVAKCSIEKLLFFLLKQHSKGPTIENNVMAKHAQH